MLGSTKFEPSKNIAVIEIDWDSINTHQANTELKMLSITKSTYADLVRKLNTIWVKKIGFDIIFQNTDPSEWEFIKTLEQAGNVVIGTNAPPAQDTASSNSLCVPDKENTSVITCTDTPRSTYKNIPWWLIQSGKTRLTAVDFLWRENIPTTEWRENGFDLLTARNDIRNIKFAWRQNINPKEGYIYSLPIEMTRDLESATTRMLTEGVPKYFLTPYFLGKNQKIDSDPYTTIPLNAFLENPEDFSSVLSGAYVFVGVKSIAIGDNFIAPHTNQLIPWVYSHAYFLDWILQNKIPFKIGTPWAVALYIVVVLLSVIMYYFLPKYISPFIAILCIILSIAFWRLLYGKFLLVIDIFPLMLAAGLISYPITYIYKFFIVDRDKRVILTTFSRYLSPEVVRMIDANNITATLGWEKKELSILFSDIAGFTTISEKMDTKELFLLMTTYLSRMTRILTEEKWTLDKYIGDAVMGFFWAPVSDPDHAMHACNTALKMRRALSSINADFESQNIPPVDFRVGIATWEVMVGNIGSEDRFNYTVLWDTVNLASRLEATGKEYWVHIIIAASTRSAIGGAFHVRELDYIAVKWKQEWVRIFELLDPENSLDDAIYSSYESALKLYRDNKFYEAWVVFAKFMEIDPPSRIMAERCASILKWEITVKDWLYIMTHK